MSKFNPFIITSLFTVALVSAGCRVDRLSQVSKLFVSPTEASFDQPCPSEMIGGPDEALPVGQGATMPWEEIQAEEAETNAKLIGPCRQKWDINHIEAEAIGRKAVVLRNNGDYVRFKPKATHNSIVVRYSVPDAPSGGGQKFTLGLYVNGSKVTSLSLSSEHSWNYRGQLLGDPVTDKPDVQPHTFFDEVHYLFPSKHSGDTIELRRESEDTAAFYVIDLADFEDVAPPTEKPDGFISVEEFGIHPNDGLDHAADLERALFINPFIGEDPYHNERKLWFPPGEYIIEGFKAGVTKPNPTEQEKAPLGNEGLDCHNCEIRGAGMWHTKLKGRRAMFFCLGGVSETVNLGGCHFKDFAIEGTTKTRSEEVEGPQKAFAGPLGSQSTIDNVWIEHVVAGIWVGNDPPNQARATENLKVTNCRIRNTYADGINFANGTSNSSVENCHIRNTGDDGIAVWSVNWPDWVKDKTYVDPKAIREDALNEPGQGVGHGNTFRKVSVQMPWRANCFATYGGHGNIFENNTCEDVLTYPGILVDNEFSPYDFGPSTTVFRNITLNRAGGTMFYEGTGSEWNHGALKFYTREGSVNDILVENVDIVSPTFSGIEFRGFGPQFLKTDINGVTEKVHPDILASAAAAKITNVTLNNVKVRNPGTSSLTLFSGAGVGSVNIQNVQLAPPFLNNKTDNDTANFFVGKFVDPSGAPIDALESDTALLAKATTTLAKRGLGMNSYFDDAATKLPLADSEKAKLTDPGYNPFIPGDKDWKHSRFTVVLYPNAGKPMPGDAAQKLLNNCQMVSVINSLAYQAPQFIKKIIKDLGSGNFEVSLFDPSGAPIKVVVNSEFLTTRTGLIIAASGLRDNQPNWLSVLEKAILKYNIIYGVWPISASYGGSTAFDSAVAAPILTGDGTYHEFDSGSLASAKELRDLVTGQLSNGKLIVAGFSDKRGCGLDNVAVDTMLKHAYTVLYPLPGSPIATLNPYGWDYKAGTKIKNLSHDGIMDFVPDDQVSAFIKLYVHGSGDAVSKGNNQDYVKAGFFAAPANSPPEPPSAWSEFWGVVKGGVATIFAGLVAAGVLILGGG